MFMMPGSRAGPRLKAYDQAPYQISTSITPDNSLIITLNQVPGPVPLIEFRDATSVNGDSIFRTIPSGSKFIINSGNTMGAANGVPFRLWALGFDNGSGISVGAINCLVGGASPTQIFGLDESSVQSPTGGNGGSTAGTFFCAQAMTNRPFRILGYLEWPSGLATAGTWNVKPKTQLFGPGIKKPGDIFQTVAANNLAGQSGISATSLTAVTTSSFPSLSLNSAVNLVKYRIACQSAVTNVAGTNTNVTTTVARSSIGIGSQYTGSAQSGAGGNGWQGPMTFEGIDNPGSTSSQTYQLQAKVTGATATVSVTNISGSIDEIQV